LLHHPRLLFGNSNADQQHVDNVRSIEQNAAEPISKSDPSTRDAETEADIEETNTAATDEHEQSKTRTDGQTESCSSRRRVVGEGKKTVDDDV